MTTLKEVAPYHYTLPDDHPVVQELKKCYKWYSPKFSPHDVPCFADVSSVTESASAMKAIRDFVVAHCRSMSEPPTHILGFDARGFLFGPMISVELGIPFVLMRKAEKNAGPLIKSEPYDKEYKQVAPEIMTVRQGSIPKGGRVLLIDDVLATGGTALSGMQLVEASGATVSLMVCVMVFSALQGVERIHSTANGQYKTVPYLTLVSDKILTEENCGDIPDYHGPRVQSYSDAMEQNNKAGRHA